MTRANSPADGVACHLYDILLAATAASALLTMLISSNEIFLNAQFFGWEMGLNYTLQRSQRDSVGETLAFCLWALALTIVVFFLLRILNRLSPGRKIVRTITGVIVVALPPMCFRFVELYRYGGRYWGWAWLRFEGCAVIGCALLYACNRWRIPAWITIALLTLHGVLWLQAYSAIFEVFAFCLRTVPIGAYFSTLMWGYCVERSRQQQSAP